MEARLTPMKNDEPLIRLGDGEVLVGQLGSYVSIRQKGIRILGLVFKDYEKIESRPGPASIGSTEKSRYVSLIPLGEINAKGVFQRGVRHYPTTGAEVFTVGIDELKPIFMKFRGYGFNLGYIPTHPDLGVSLDPSAMFGRHFAILGQSGSGKSWAVASVVQRAVAAMPNAHVILLDLHGEYSWLDEKGERQYAFHPENVCYFDARDLEIPYWLMTFAELIDLLIDRSDAGASVQIAFLREILYELKKKSAKRLAIDTISIDSPIYFSLGDLYNSFKDANEQRSDFGKTKGALFGQFDEFLVKLHSRVSDTRYDFLLKPKKRTSSETLSGLLRDFIGLGNPKKQITIIDLSPVPFDVRPGVSAQIGRLAFEFNYWNPRNREFPILLLCEEAHAYIPRDSDSQYEGTRKSMERIAKEGRKYGVGLGVVSQRPHELSETVLSQCGTYICLRITNPDDQSYVRDLVPESEGDLTDILSALGRGEAMILGEGTPLPIRFQIYRPDPLPNSSDVDYFKNWKEGPEDLDVEGIVHRWRRQGR
ncbi:MAG: ATP-binding protein [Methylococcales bacterium]